jgi:hypothetical protein
MATLSFDVSGVQSSTDLTALAGTENMYYTLPSTIAFDQVNVAHKPQCAIGFYTHNSTAAVSGKATIRFNPSNDTILSFSFNSLGTPGTFWEFGGQITYPIV